MNGWRSIPLSKMQILKAEMPYPTELFENGETVPL
jgi:hypothetical protein